MKCSEGAGLTDLFLSNLYNSHVSKTAYINFILHQMFKTVKSVFGSPNIKRVKTVLT